MYENKKMLPPTPQKKPKPQKTPRDYRVNKMAVLKCHEVWTRNARLGICLTLLLEWTIHPGPL